MVISPLYGFSVVTFQRKSGRCHLRRLEGEGIGRLIPTSTVQTLRKPEPATITYETPSIASAIAFSVIFLGTLGMLIGGAVWLLVRLF